MGDRKSRKASDFETYVNSTRKVLYFILVGPWFSYYAGKGKLSLPRLTEIKSCKKSKGKASEHSVECVQVLHDTASSHKSNSIQTFLNQEKDV